MTREELARLVLEALDARRAYYLQDRRSEPKFEAMVALEARLRVEAELTLEDSRK